MVMINNREFTIGADPEFFVTKNGKPVSAHGLIPGDKKNPHKVAFGAVQVDGMALEFNIAPVKGEAGFLRNLNAVMDQIMAMVPGYEFYDRPVAQFGLDYILQQPEEARILGCEPDFNAYTGDPNPTPNAQTPFRTAAGHIHIGWTKDVDPMDPGHFEACRILTKCMDAFVGIPSVLWDDDKQRRELYGKAGAFRPKPYGMEYRTLSNRWLRKDLPHVAKCVYGNTIEAIKMAFKDPEFGDKDFMGKKVYEIINNSDLDAVKNILSYNPDIPSPAKYRGAA